jgi:hypothetical protein
MDAKVTDAEIRVSALEKRMLLLEQSHEYAVTSTTGSELLNEYQVEVLRKLKQVRDAVLQDLGDIDEMKRQRDEAVALNTQLNREVEQMQYRIKHLIRSLNEAQTGSK